MNHGLKVIGMILVGLMGFGVAVGILVFRYLKRVPPLATGGLMGPLPEGLIVGEGITLDSVAVVLEPISYEMWVTLREETPTTNGSYGGGDEDLIA